MAVSTAIFCIQPLRAIDEVISSYENYLSEIMKLYLFPDVS